MVIPEAVSEYMSKMGKKGGRIAAQHMTEEELAARARLGAEARERNRAMREHEEQLAERRRKRARRK